MSFLRIGVSVPCRIRHCRHADGFRERRSAPEATAAANEVDEKKDGDDELMALTASLCWSASRLGSQPSQSWHTRTHRTLLGPRRARLAERRFSGSGIVGPAA